MLVPQYTIVCRFLGVPSVGVYLLNLVQEFFIGGHISTLWCIVFRVFNISNKTLALIPQETCVVVCLSQNK